MNKEQKIAIVYDWIDKWGGVERVLLNLHEMFPEAIFYTSYFDQDKASWAKNLKIKTSFLQNFPDFIKKNRLLSLPFYPFVFESFDFSEYDLVISVTSSFAKSIITKPGTRHICYLLTPTRYLWSQEKNYIKKNYELWVKGYIDFLKKWDFVSAQRPDKIISISETVKKRCLKYYKRNSEVVYPGFDADYWNKVKSQIINNKLQINFKFQISNFKFFLVVSRLEPYKKVDLVIQSFNRLKYKLIIVGEGTQEKKLKQIANDNVSFLSKLTDIELGSLYLNAHALIMPQEEDFGYVSLEAQFFGCPIIAYKKGGALETVIENKTGLFFETQDKESLVQAIERFDKIKYNLRKELSKTGLKNIEEFSKEKFVSKFKQIITP